MNYLQVVTWGGEDQRQIFRKEKTHSEKVGKGEKMTNFLQRDRGTFYQ